MRPRGEALLEGDSDSVWAWAQLVKGSRKRSLRSTTCSGESGFLTFLKHSWQTLYLSGGCLGPTDMSGVPGVLFEMLVFGFSAINRHSHIYSTLTLWKPGIWWKLNQQNTQVTSCLSLQGWFHGGKGWAHAPTNIPVRCYWVGGMNRYHKVVNIIELPQVRQLVLRILKQKVYIARVLTSWRKWKESDPYYTRPSYLWPPSPAFCTLCLCSRVLQRSTIVREGRGCHWGRVGFQKRLSRLR